ncbi:hypothetical protein [Luteibacter sp. CQ10]|uniref:hypothetical protein n=1 Tax=Luteibacter sp. CQ10 TaxID=2805821 RepID=UPI0034A45F5A
MKNLLIIAAIAFSTPAVALAAGVPSGVAGAGLVENFENLPSQPPTLSLDLPSMAIDSYYNGNPEGQRPMLAIESGPASSMNGHHLVVRTEYQPVSQWHDGGFWLTPKGPASGIHFKVEVNRPKKQRMTLACQSAEAFDTVDVWLPDRGEVTAHCPSSMQLSFIQFFAVGEDLTFRFDDIELK